MDIYEESKKVAEKQQKTSDNIFTYLNDLNELVHNFMEELENNPNKVFDKLNTLSNSMNNEQKEFYSDINKFGKFLDKVYSKWHVLLEI